MRIKAWWEKIFGQKYYLAPPGYDPTVDPLPDPLTNRRSSGGGCGVWLPIGGLSLLLVALIAGTVWGLFFRTAHAAAPPPTASVAAPLPGPLGQLTRRPTRTPLVFPTVGVVSATPFSGARPTITPVVFPTQPGGPIGPTNTPPPYAPTVARPPGGGGGGNPAPQPTYTPLRPLPTYTPFPTYTAVPVLAQPTASPTHTATPTETATPEPTETCAPTATPEPTLEPTATSELPVESTGDVAWLYLPLYVDEPGEWGC